MSDSGMSFISGGNEPLDAFDPESINHQFFELKLSEMDYFLNFRINWDVISTPLFEMAIGGSLFYIPSDFHVMIADVYGNVDWIPVNEMIDREVEVAVFDPSFETWRLDHPRLTNKVTDKEFHWPMTKNVVPILSSNNVILLSQKDHYHKTKHYLIDSFLTTG